jgi:hypothetical protein
MDPLQILVGVGRLYAAPKGTAFPKIDAAPAVDWIDLGVTDGGVTVSIKQTIEMHRVDQETGAVKATRTEEDLTIETSLALNTLENLAEVMGNTVTDTAATAADAGYRTLGLARGADVEELAFLFRGKSPYMADRNAQYELPRGVFNQDEIGTEYTKEGKAMIPCTFSALVDPDASSDDEKFGRLKAQDADATA